MYVKVTCPNCRRSSRLVASAQGKSVQCPNCAGRFVAAADPPQAEGAIPVAEEALPIAEAAQSEAAWVASAEERELPLKSAKLKSRAPRRPMSRSQAWVRGISLILVLGVLGGLGYLALFVALPSWLDERAWANWRIAAPPGGNFRVLMPGEPTLQQKTEKTPAGDVPTNVYVAHMARQNLTFEVGYSDLPEPARQATAEQVEKVLDGARDGMIEDSKGKLLDEKPIVLSRYPGRELQIDIPDKGRSLVRLYFAKTQLYLVAATGPGLQADSAAVERFFSSFRLTGVNVTNPNPPPPPPAEPPAPSK